MNEHPENTTIGGIAVRLASLAIRDIEETSRAQLDAIAFKELLLQTLEMLGERDRELKQVRERYYALLDERRKLKVAA